MESTELQSACCALGFKERSTYRLEPDALSTVKLLIRFLRNEPDGYSVRLQLGYAQIVQNDIIPILQHHSSNRELADATLRLLLNLSQPTLVCFQGRVPTDATTRKVFLELDRYLLGYKQAFANVDFLKVITASMAKLVKSEHEGKLREEDRLVLERYLLLIRNILHIDEAKFKESGLAGEDLSGPGVHDELVLAISRSGLDRIILYMATSAEEHGFALHILEILWLLFKDITPSLLVAASKNDGSGALKLNLDDLNDLKRQSSGGSVSSYRAELKGTFAVRNKWLNAPSSDGGLMEKGMVIHKHSGPNDAASALDVIANSKKRAKKSSQRDIALEDTLERQRADVITTVRPAVRDFLTTFARRLLVDASGYNNMMAAADRIITNAPADSHDESFYLWAVAFFMELARGLISSSFPISKAVECVGQTLGIEALTFVHTHMTTYADGLETDRFDKQMWNKRLVLAVRAFNEQIAWADALARCKDDPSVAELGRTLVFNIVYEPQFRDVLPQMLKRYKESRHCRAYLRSLVAAVHTHLKLMDFLEQSGNDTVVIAQKAKMKKVSTSKKSAKNKNKKKNKEQFVKQPWSDIVIGLKEAITAQQLHSDDPDDPEQTDSDDPIVRGVVEPALVASSEVDDVVKYQSVVSRIGQLLLRHEPKYAVSALHLARKLFPEHAERYFGGTLIEHGDDEKFFENLYETTEFIEDDDSEEERKENERIEEDDDDDGENEFGIAKPSAGKEISVNVAELAVKFCSVPTLIPYISLFETWQSNDTETNHHVARFLKRVAIDWHLPAMLYQLRVFVICQQLLTKAEAASTAKMTPPAPELVSFAKFAVNGFLKLAQQVGKAAFAEVLFWKHRIDALAFASNYENLRNQPVVPVEAERKEEEDGEEGSLSKKSVGKKGKKNNGEEENGESAFDRLIRMQEASVKRDEGSSDDGDDEAWLKLVDDKNDPAYDPTMEGVEGGEVMKRPKKKRVKKTEKEATVGENNKKARKRRAAMKIDEFVADEKKSQERCGSSATSSISNNEQRDDDDNEAKSAKRPKILLDSSSDDDSDVVLAVHGTKPRQPDRMSSPSSPELEIVDEKKNQDSDDQVVAIRRVKPAMKKDEPPASLSSSLSSLDLEIVDETAGNNDDNKDEDEDELLKNARLHLSDSDDSDEAPLKPASRKTGNDLADSDEELTQKKKTTRRLIDSDDDE